MFENILETDDEYEGNISRKHVMSLLRALVMSLLRFYLTANDFTEILWNQFRENYSVIVTNMIPPFFSLLFILKYKHIIYLFVL